MTSPLGRLLRTRRADLNLTQGALALAVGVPRQFVVRWETGARPVPEASLPGIAAALGVPEPFLRSLLLDPPRRTRALKCGYAPLDPVKCTVEEMAAGTSLGRRLSATVRERLGEARYDELRHALLRDTRWELLLAHYLLLDTADLQWRTPLEEGCRLLIVGEDRHSFTGHLLRLAIVWERDDERMVFFPQVPVAVPKADERFRLDYLVLPTRRGSPMPAVGLELDGASAHRFRQAQDERRSSLLGIPVARFDNTATEDPCFLGALFDAIREKCEYAKVNDEAWQGFLADRRDRAKKATAAGQLRP